MGYEIENSRSGRIRKLASTGLLPFEIKQITGESYNLIYHVRRKLGLTKITPPKPPVVIPPLEIPLSRKPGKWAPHMDRIRQLKHQGASYADIAKQYGVTRNRIQQLIQVECGEKCERCGATAKLHGHHKNYLTDDSETLCISCHRQEHSIDPASHDF